MSASAHPEVMEFLRSCERRLASLATTPQARGAAAALKNALDHASPIDYTPSTVPVLAGIDAATDTPLARECLEVKDALAWVPSFRMTDEGTTVALMAFNELFDLGGCLLYTSPSPRDRG